MQVRGGSERRKKVGLEFSLEGNPKDWRRCFFVFWGVGEGGGRKDPEQILRILRRGKIE